LESKFIRFGLPVASWDLGGSPEIKTGKKLLFSPRVLVGSLTLSEDSRLLVGCKPDSRAKELLEQYQAGEQTHSLTKFTLKTKNYHKVKAK